MGKLTKLTAWLERRWHKLFPKRKNPFSNQLFRFRMAQAALAGMQGGGHVVWIGDSRIHQFEAQINARPGNLCLAVSGSKLEDWIPVVEKLLALAKPCKVIDDTAGNNALAGQTAKEMREKKYELIKRIHFPCVRLDVPYLGIESPVNDVLRHYNEWLFATQSGTVLSGVLSPTGRLDPAYDCGDGIHFSSAAWPVIASVVDSAKAQ